MLSAQEVYQVLREALSGTRSMRRITQESWNEIYCGLMTVQVDGWQITFFVDCGDLDYCDNCISTDERKYEFSSLNGLDPVGLLASDEHHQLEEMLRHI